ncbi:MAG: TetR/AcrR family transcriptional regulator [Chloroflexota bacterium]
MTELPLTTRRERRIAARTQQILDAAAYVFSKVGYESATTKQIAEAADVSEGTLYNYFKSKQELLIEIAKAYADEVAADLATVEGNTLEEILAQLMAKRFRVGQERRLFMVFLHEARHNADVHQYYVEGAIHRIIQEAENHISTLVEAGRIRDVDPFIAARTMCAAIMGFAALFELGVTVNHSSPEKLGHQVTDIFLNGLKKN